MAWMRKRKLLPLSTKSNHLPDSAADFDGLNGMVSGSTRARRRGLVILAVLIIASVVATGCGSPKPLNVVLISIDTLRADHLGCYGYADGGTPNLDRFAARSLRFTRCYSPIPVTLPSHTSMLTGMIPPRHSVRDNGTFSVPEDLPTLATVLKEAGYTTIGVIGAFPLISTSGFARGFDVYDESLESHSDGVLSVFFDERPADQVTHRAQDYLRKYADEPFFMFVHYYDVHQPWEAPEPYASAFRRVPYDAEVAYTDHWVGKLLDSITALDLDRRTVVIVTADHGDGLMEHGEISHSLQIYNTTLHVPLFLSAPGVAAGVVERPVGTVDIAPTVAELVGLKPFEDIDGTSLLHPEQGERLLYSETLVGRLLEGWNGLRGCISGDYKYIRAFKPELYDLSKDPSEEHNVAAEHPDVLRDLDGKLLDVIRKRSSAYRIADRFRLPDENTRANLVALGYLSSSAPPSDLEELAPLIADRDPMLHMEVFNQLNRAKQMMADYDFLSAISLLKEAIDVNPESHELLKTLVSAMVMTRDYKGALSHVDELLNMVGDEPGTLRLVAAACRGAGDLQRGLEMIDKAIERQGDSASFELKADILSDLGDLKGAMAAVEEGLRAKPCSSDLLVNLAERLRREARRDDAVATYQRMVECGGAEVPQALFNLGNLALEAGDVEKAMKHFAETVRIKPFYAPGHYGLAVAKLVSEDLSGAKAEATETLRLSGADTQFGVKAAALLTEIESRTNGS